MSTNYTWRSLGIITVLRCSRLKSVPKLRGNKPLVQSVLQIGASLPRAASVRAGNATEAHPDGDFTGWYDDET